MPIAVGMALYEHSKAPVPGHVVRVVLTRDNATLALVCGALRRQANFGKEDSASYRNQTRKQPEAFASPAGCAAEIAVAQHLGMHWNARAWHARDHHRYRHMADVGDNIEVKRIRDDKQHVEVKRKEFGHHRILWVVRTVGTEHLELDLCGWTSLDHAWRVGIPTRRRGVIDPDSRTIPLTKLNPCTCLTGTGKHAPEPPITPGSLFQVPTTPRNNAGADNPNCISRQSATITRALFTAANTANPA